VTERLLEVIYVAMNYAVLWFRAIGRRRRGVVDMTCKDMMRTAYAYLETWRKTCASTSCVSYMVLRLGPL